LRFDLIHQRARKKKKEKKKKTKKTENSIFHSFLQLSKMYISPLFKGKIRFPAHKEMHLLLCFYTAGSLDLLLQLFLFFYSFYQNFCSNSAFRSNKVCSIPAVDYARARNFGALELTLLAGWILALQHCLALRASIGALKRNALTENLLLLLSSILMALLVFFLSILKILKTQKHCKTLYYKEVKELTNAN